MKHTVSIEKIISGGKGLARTASGQVIMTPFCLPNEQAVIREENKKSGYIEGIIDTIIRPSPARIKPCCPVYGECGGCDLQHGSYTEQLIIKQGIVAESLQRAKVSVEQVRNTLASPVQWGYRSRLRLKINPAGQLGFFKKRSNTFIPLADCPVATSGICSAISELNKTEVLRPLAGAYLELELLESPADGKITLILRENKQQSPPTAALRELAELTSISHVGRLSRKGLQYISSQAEPLSQHIRLTERDCMLSWAGACFSQVNPGQNEQIIKLVCELAGELHGKTVLDLYCGMGNFSIPLGLCGGTLTGIEGNEESIRWAEKNARQAGITARFFVADVRSALKQLAKQQERTDIVLLDPPRSGVGKNISLLPLLEPNKIISVSCDPATLARDLNMLCSHNYKITSAIPVDMFPQTSHVESVVLLERQ